MIREIMAGYVKSLGQKLVTDEDLIKQPVVYVEASRRPSWHHVGGVESAYGGKRHHRRRGAGPSAPAGQSDSQSLNCVRLLLMLHLPVADRTDYTRRGC